MGKPKQPKFEIEPPSQSENFSVEAPAPTESGWTRFLHHAGLPGTAEEAKRFLPYSDTAHVGLPEHAGTLLESMGTPQPSQVPGAQPIVKLPSWLGGSEQGLPIVGS